MVLIISALCSLSANASERVTLEGANATVEAPTGWIRMPVSGEAPLLMFDLCDSHVADGCAVRAELILNQLLSIQAPASFDEKLEEWKKIPIAKIVSAPVRKSIGKNEAIEIVVKQQHSIHQPKIVNSGTILMRAGDHYYSCSIMVDPGDYATLKQVWQDFCASLNFDTVKPG